MCKYDEDSWNMMRMFFSDLKGIKYKLHTVSKCFTDKLIRVHNNFLPDSRIFSFKLCFQLSTNNVPSAGAINQQIHTCSSNTTLVES